MTADFEFSITIHGTIEEIFSILEVMTPYTTGKKSAYFDFPNITVNEEELYIDFEDEDELRAAIEESNGTITLSAGGPYGSYCGLDEIDIFRDMAAAAPNASFDGEITGGTSYTEESIVCELKDKILHVSSSFLSNDEIPEYYLEYFKKQLPYKMFIEKFKIDPEQFSEDDYDEFVDDTFLYEEFNIADMDFDEFIESLEVDCDLEPEEFEAVKEELSSLTILPFEEFMDDCDAGDVEEYDYDPITKTYIGREKQPTKPNTAYELTDTIRDYLKSHDLPYDDEAIDSLSLDDVYAIVAGTYAVSAGIESPEASAEGSEETTDAASEAISEGSEEAAAEVTVAAVPVKDAAQPSESDNPGDAAPEASYSEELQAETDAEAEETASAEAPAAPIAETENKTVDTSKVPQAGMAWLAWLITALFAAGFLAAYLCSGTVMESVNTAVNGILAIFR